MTLLAEKPEISTLDLKQADPDELRRYAIELAGRPVPGVRMTADEFEAWAIDHADAEWKDGRIYLMSPANDFHEERDEWLGRLLGDWIERHDLGTLRRNMTVRLSPSSRRVPDMMFIASANRRIIQSTYIDGPPDLIVEIVSPDSQDRDRREKFQEYQAGGVPEYWIVDPLSRRLDTFRLVDGVYQLLPPVDDKVTAAALPGLYVRPSWLFGEELPKVRDCLEEIEAAPQKPAQPQPPASA